MDGVITNGAHFIISVGIKTANASGLIFTSMEALGPSQPSAVV